MGGEPSSTSKVDCDLLVVGSGAAGFMAALSAARAGLKVVVLEKTETVGGTTAGAGVTATAGAGSAAGEGPDVVSAISCGAAAAVAVRLAAQPEFMGKTIVVILPDSGERYLSSILYDGIT